MQTSMQRRQIELWTAARRLVSEFKQIFSYETSEKTKWFCDRRKNEKKIE